MITKADASIETLTKREHFAGLAMQALLSTKNPDIWGDVDNPPQCEVGDHEFILCKKAVQMANMLIATLNGTYTSNRDPAPWK